MARISLGLFLALAFASVANAETLLGFPDKVVDGATFSLCEGRACKMVHLCGVDAPKPGDANAEQARTELRTILGGNMVKCIGVGGGTPCDGLQGATMQDMIVAQCMIGSHDIAERMVTEGHDCDLVKSSGGHYSNGNQEKACPQ